MLPFLGVEIMKVKEIAAGKKACVLIDCDTATLYYPREGDEKNPESECISISLEFKDEDETNAVAEASRYLGLQDSEIELASA